MNLLEFANPSFAWFGLILLPIIGLYILKVRLRRVPASTLLFWNQLYDEKKPRSWWQRLRHWLSLLLQLLVAGLLVSAIVDPLWSWQRQEARRIVLVIDNSASMQTELEGTSRLELAKQTATELIRSMRDRDQMAIVSAGGRPEVVWGMTEHQRWLTDATRDLPTTDAPAVLSESVELGKRLLSGAENGELIVITDGCNEQTEALAEDETITLYGVGSEQDNVGITRYQVRRSLVDAVGYQVLIDVTNYSKELQDLRIELDLEGELVDVLPVSIPAGESITRVVDHTSANGGELKATIDVDDAFAIDNVARAILPTRKTIPIQLVTEGNLFAMSVLDSIPLVQLTVLEELNPKMRAAITVFDQKVPENLPPGPILVIDPQTSCELWQLGDPVDEPIVAKVDEDSPLTKHVRLDNVLFPDARSIDYQVPFQNLIEDPFENGLLTRVRRPQGDVVVLSCSLEKGDLPLRIAFPVLMKNTIEWFQGDAGQLRAAAQSGTIVSVSTATLSPPPKQDVAKAETNDTSSEGSNSQETSSVGNATPDADEDVVLLATSADDNLHSIELVSPTGEVASLTASDDQVLVGPLLTTGLWTIRTASGQTEPEEATPQTATETEGDLEAPSTGDALEEVAANGEMQLACNLASMSESNLTPRVELNAFEVSQTFLLGGRSIWFYLTLLAAFVIATEWWLFQRRIVG